MNPMTLADLVATYRRGLTEGSDVTAESSRLFELLLGPFARPSRRPIFL